MMTRRNFLRNSSLAGVVAGSPVRGENQQEAGPVEPRPALHRTQFDQQLLFGHECAASALSNQGRQMIHVDGATHTALAGCGNSPVLRLWRNYELIAEHKLPDQASPPSLVMAGDRPSLWISIGGVVCCCRPVSEPPRPVSNLKGEIRDAVALSNGSVLLAISQGPQLTLVRCQGETIEQTLADDDAGHASLELDESGIVHLAFEKRQGIEYRAYDARKSFRDAKPLFTERVAEAFGSQPVLLAYGRVLLLAYLGESCRLPTEQPAGEAWERQGRGGYIAALSWHEGHWTRERLADSRQITKSLYPIGQAFGQGRDRPLRVRIEEFSAPALCLGPDSVPQVFWADKERRWIYASRFLGERFSPPVEVRGPLEQLIGPCLLPRRLPRDLTTIPIGIVTTSRTYLDRIALPKRAVTKARRIDFVQMDELARCRGCEIQIDEMQRHPENPVIAVDSTDPYAGGLVAYISRDDGKWRADVSYLTSEDIESRANWRTDGMAVSEDGLHWKKLPPVPLAERFKISGATRHILPVKFVRDPGEKNELWRYKGLWRSPEHEPWGHLPVTSPDGLHWTIVPDRTDIVRADTDLRIWIDNDDVPERRYKASGISRSFCGRVCAQWTSQDGIHWKDERETLDFADPFNKKPDKGTTGRILLDSWSGPDDEDEIHGGFVFRDGERWLLHYMKWTPDGHIYCALASSHDGINFSRASGGSPTLPLGEPGTWDGGRVAISEAPFRVGEMWRQYYTGCGWKHGMAARGNWTSHFGHNAPNQMGIAEIPVGHWAHLRIGREVESGEITTTTFRLQTPCDLAMDVEGVGQNAFLSCGIIDPKTDRFIKGFESSVCHPVRQNGKRVPVKWRKGTLRDIGICEVRLRVSLHGHTAKLFGLELQPVGR